MTRTSVSTTGSGRAKNNTNKITKQVCYNVPVSRSLTRTARPGQSRAGSFPSAAPASSTHCRVEHSRSQTRVRWRIRILLAPDLYSLMPLRHSERHPKPPTRGICLPFAVSLWDNGAYNRFFLCMEASYHAKTTHRKAQNKSGTFNCLEMRCVAVVKTLA